MLAILRARGTDRFSILSLPRARVVDEGMVSLPLEAPMRGFDGFFSAMGVLGGCSQKEMELFLGTTCVNVLVIGSKLSSMADCGLLARTLHFGFLIHGSISSYSWDGAGTSWDKSGVGSSPLFCRQRYVSENISYGRLVRHGQRRYKLCGEHRELATSETTRELPASEITRRTSLS
ncbi:hypothetical protein DY000_02018262 [Brassica cretica]|uniref:Uncharacterized protein n=1 Tax=Brassica cretica TaxID=69181 RepID=A0ABQ7CVT4_BRACR|nr:hypothetical protein DY000_02018262 [Brassica cretica]